MAQINIEVMAQVDDAVRGLQTATSSFGNLQHANQDAAGALGVFGVSLTALNNPITLVASTIKDSIDTANQWSETVQKLSAESGQSAEASSKMAVVMGDLGVNVDSLNGVVKAFTKEGLAFNLDTMKHVITQYQAITDPVERNAFAFAHFGRSANDLNQLLAATPGEIDALSTAAEHSGKILTDVQIKAIEDARVEWKQYGDMIDGLKIKLGEFSINGLMKAADSVKNLAGIEESLIVQAEVYTGRMTWQQAAIVENQIAQGNLGMTLQSNLIHVSNVSDATDRLTAAQSYHMAAISSDGSATSVYTRSLMDMAQAQTASQTASDAATKALQSVQTATVNAYIANDNLFQSLAKVTSANLATAAIKDLQTAMSANPGDAQAYEAAIEKIGVKAGLMTPAGIAAGQALTELGTALTTHRIDPEQYATALDNIPDAIHKNGGVVPSLKDLGIALDPKTMHMEDARSKADDFGTSLTTLTNQSISPTNKALDTSSGLGATVGHVQDSMGQLVNLGLIPFGSQLDALVTGHISPANKALSDMKTDIDNIQSKTVTITVITRHVDQYANSQ